MREAAEVQGGRTVDPKASGPGQGGQVNDSYAVPPILKQYWHTALRWRWLIGAIIAGALAVGLVVTLLTPARYTAGSQIEISREQKKITNVEGLDSSTADSDMEFYETQYALLRSYSLGERVARKLDLGRSDDFFAAHGITLDAGRFGAAGQSNLTAGQLAAREKLAAKLLLDNIEVSPVRRSRLVNLSYTSRSAGLSARVVNAWASQFIAASMDRQL
ncbi:Wzz/FepE/Etk N-terminal domain-containing protein, partial [Rhizorhabdus wittichii]|uniref:Wzz/FepE/Etk N-terminal domain-containing protein n=1 Tax=Rhizorhabdus wittichii TaxID=160791 RepID=UPI0021F87279